jgi:uncharacterized protein YqgC (DUF456 family)
MEYLWATLLALASLVGWGLNIFGIPGNWLTVGVAILYASLLPNDARVALSGSAVAALVGLAVLGEIVEFAAGAAGAKRAGGSKRAAVLALIGALAGGLLGIFVGIPIPVVGPVLSAILLSAAGALGGAMLGESSQGRSWEESWGVGKAAFWGRILGTLGKIVVGSIMVAIVFVALIVK